jgi:hypothetical protein
MDYIDTLGMAFLVFFGALLCGYGLTEAIAATAVTYIIGGTIAIFRMRREIMKLRAGRE